MYRTPPPSPVKRVISDEALLRSPTKKQIAAVSATITSKEITLDQTHANAMRIIYELQLHGIIEIDEEQDYETLYNLYSTDKLSSTSKSNHIREFGNALDNITIHNPKNLSIRFGDIVAGSGNNDLFILLILRRLHRSDVEYVILISDPVALFIIYYETYTVGHLTTSPTAVPGYDRKTHRSLYTCDSHLYPRANKDKKIGISKSEFLELKHEYFDPYVRLIDYHLTNNEFNQQEIKLFGCRVSDVIAVGKLSCFELEFEVDVQQPRRLALLINNINRQFTEYVLNGDSKSLYAIAAIERLLKTNCTAENTNQLNLCAQTPKKIQADSMLSATAFEETTNVSRLNPDNAAYFANNNLAATAMRQVTASMGHRAFRSRKQKIMQGLQTYVQAKADLLTPEDLVKVFICFLEAVFTPRMFWLIGTTKSGNKMLSLFAISYYVDLLKLLDINGKLNAKSVIKYIRAVRGARVKKKQLYAFWGFSDKSQRTTELTTEMIEEKLNINARP